MITLRDVFNYLACQEADRIYWYKESISKEGPKSDQWASYVRSKGMASLYLTAIAIVKYFGLSQEAFKKKVFKHEVYEALRKNPRIGSHCHRRAARKLARRALKQIKKLPLEKYEGEGKVAAFLEKRAKDRKARMAGATR